MIEFTFQNRDYGDDVSFENMALAMGFVEEQIRNWDTALGSFEKASSVHGVEKSSKVVQLLRSWRSLKLAFTIQANTRDSPIVKDQTLCRFDSPIGTATIWMLRFRTVEETHTALIALGFLPGAVNWADDAAMIGILLFERVRSAVRKLRNDQSMHGVGGQLASITAESEAINARLQNLSTEITAASNLAIEVATTTQQTREEFRVSDLAQEVHARERYDRILGEANTARDTVSVQLTELGGKVESALLEAESRVKSWIAAQDEQRELAAPARLWADRATTHASKADKLFRSSIVVGVVGLIVTGGVASGSFVLSKHLFLDALVPGPLTPGALKPTFHYQLLLTGAATIAWLTMYLWAMRVLVRLYTTEHHLAIDASARGAMNDTYLGLIAAGAANEQDRPIVLNALFRPVQDGIVKDDGPPGITPAALLAGALSGHTK